MQDKPTFMTGLITEENADEQLKRDLAEALRRKAEDPYIVVKPHVDADEARKARNRRKRAARKLRADAKKAPAKKNLKPVAKKLSGRQKVKLRKAVQRSEKLLQIKEPSK